MFQFLGGRSGAFELLSHNGEITVKDLVSYGFIPEFASRMGNSILLEPLSEDIIKQLIHRQVAECKNYIALNELEINAYTELIHSATLADKTHLEMGGRCVGPMGRKFFEDLFVMEIRRGQLDTLKAILLLLR